MARWHTPNEIPQGAICRPLFIPADESWLALISGALAELTAPHNWEQVGALTPLECAERMAQMFQEYINGICGIGEENLDVRQNPDTPCLLEKDDGSGWQTFADLRLCPPKVRLTSSGAGLEVSTNGGVTWNEAELPAIPPAPVVAGHDTLCNAAASAVEVYRQTMSEIFRLFNDGVEVMIVVSAIIAMLASWFFFPPALPLVFSFFVELQTIVESLTVADFDSDKQEELRCIFFCAMTLDEGVARIDWASVTAEIEARVSVSPPNIWLMLRYLALIVGQDGTERAAATGVIQNAICGCEDCPPDFMLKAMDGDTGVTVEYLGINPASGWQRFRVTGKPRTTDGELSYTRVGGGCFYHRSGSETLYINGNPVTWNSIFTLATRCNGTNYNGFNKMTEWRTQQFAWVILTCNGANRPMIEFDAAPL